MSLRIKLCGVRRPEDARLCAEAGADEVGVVFASSSRRRVTFEQAQAIRAALPAGFPLIGVFLDAALDELRATVTAVALAALQLHGRIPEGAEGLGLPLFAGLQISSAASLASLEALSGRFARALLDGPRAGSGQPFPWELARAARARFHGEIFVAGGLNPGNVAEAVRLAAPDGVDVASGIEGDDGFKDPARVRAFVAAVRAT